MARDSSEKTEELVPLTDAERAELAGGESGAPADSGAAPAEQAPAASAEAQPAAGEAPAAAQGAEPPPAAPAPETAEQLRERLARREREIREDRRRFARERDRLAAALEAAERRAAASPAPAAAAPAPLPGIPVELGADGQYRIDAESLRQALARTHAAQAQAQAPAPGPSPAREVQDRAAQYDGWRAQILNEAPDPGAARTAIEALEAAYTWLDQRTVQAVREAGYMPRGVGELMNFLESEGVAREFAEKYPGIEIDELVEAPSDAYHMRRTLSRYMARASSAPAAEPARSSGPSPAAFAAMGQRPRPMAMKGRAAPIETTLQRAGSLTAKEVLRMGDEEFRELEELAKSM